MPCYHPLRAWRARTPGRNGRYPVVFRWDSSNGQEVQLPCGQCIGCRVDKSKEWALRCVHESEMHEDNAFITLTYDDKHLPYDGSLDVSHYQKFMKRLRKRFAPKKIRFFHCGEYGEKLTRPHYHALLFGVDFPDKVMLKECETGNTYTSEILEECWGKGFTTTGDVTYESAAYVSRYVTKKINGLQAENHYQGVNWYGELVTLKPEYTTMSRRPGIGKGWLKKYGRDVYPDGYVVHGGNKYKPPRFYEENNDVMSEEAMEALKKLRRLKVDIQEQTPERLAVREKVHKARYSLAKRNLEQ